MGFLFTTIALYLRDIMDNRYTPKRCTNPIPVSRPPRIPRSRGAFVTYRPRLYKSRVSRHTVKIKLTVVRFLESHHSLKFVGLLKQRWREFLVFWDFFCSLYALR